MEQLQATVRADVGANEPGKQVQALLVALQLAAGGRDVSFLAHAVCHGVIGAGGASAVAKKLAYDVARTTRLTADQWEAACRGLAADLGSADADTAATASSFLASLPSWRVARFVADNSKRVSDNVLHDSPNVRHATIEALGCMLARDDVAAAAAASPALAAKVAAWWTLLAQSTLDVSDIVSTAAFEALGRLFAELQHGRLGQLAGDKLVPGSASLAKRLQWVLAACRFVWEKRDLLMARAAVLPLNCALPTMYPLAYAARIVATGVADELQALTGREGPRGFEEGGDFLSAERTLGVSDVVGHLMPFLTSLEPALVFEAGSNLLSLAAVPGGKPEWASAPITAFLTLWDRQEYAAGREAIVKTVVASLQLLDLHMQVALFKRLLVMVRNLRVEADRMHALACICRTALSLDLFVKESVRRGQRAIPGTDISSLFEDVHTRADLESVHSSSLFREELVACLVESCFQLSQPLPRLRKHKAGSRLRGPFAFESSHDPLAWTQSALELVEVCRRCVRWECQGRTYAMDCYLRLLLRLCHLYGVSKGKKSVSTGASPAEVLAVQRLQGLQRQLLGDLKEVVTNHMRVRLLWVLVEHLDVDGLDPLLADDPTDPINTIVAAVHKLLFNVDTSLSAVTYRLQDLQAILVCCQHLGARSPRGAALLGKELEDFRVSQLADSVNKHHCKLILQMFRQLKGAPDRRWVGWVGPTGDYPFSHHKLSVQYHEEVAAQDRKLESLVKTAVQELWHEEEEVEALSQTLTLKETSPLLARTLSGSSDPVYVEAQHLGDVIGHRLLNITDFDIGRVDVVIGITGSINFMDGRPQAIRQIKGLASQEPLSIDATFSISKFERCALCVQLLYYPRARIHVSDYDDDYQDSDRDEGGAGRSRRIEYSEPVILRCKSYSVPLTELLLPHQIAAVDFFRVVASLPAVKEFSGLYLYDSSDLRSLTAGAGTPKFMTALQALDRKPLHKLCYAANTWSGDILTMVIFGTSDLGPSASSNEEETKMVCKFVLRSSALHVVTNIAADLQDWLDDLTEGEVRLLTVEEEREEEAEKLRAAAQQALLPRLQLPEPPKAEQNEETKLVKVVIQQDEQQALQLAILREWDALRSSAAQMVH
eukprot:SM000108S14202  [mRNA]  locus=s108:143066:149764:- [translate_table: standard]